MQHHFDIDLAVKYGILEAILLNHFDFWIKHNEANGVNYADGNYWTYNSVKALQELFPYVSERKIRYAIDHLKAEDLLISSQRNAANYDRTMWYALTEKGKSLLQKCQYDSVNLSNRSGKNVEPIPVNNTDNNTDIKKSNKKTFVPPTLEEVKAYIQSRNSPVDPVRFFEYFETGHWIDSEGKPVRNWKQKLLTWEKFGNGKSVSDDASKRNTKKFDIHYDNE